MATKKTQDGTHFRNTGGPIMVDGREVGADALVPRTLVERAATRSRSVAEWVASGRLVLVTPDGEVAVEPPDAIAEATALRADNTDLAKRLTDVQKRYDAKAEAAKALSEDNARLTAEVSRLSAELAAAQESLDALTAPEPAPEVPDGANAAEMA